jgi:hypothetical protein
LREQRQANPGGARGAGGLLENFATGKSIRHDVLFSSKMPVSKGAAAVITVWPPATL